MSIKKIKIIFNLCNRASCFPTGPSRRSLDKPHLVQYLRSERNQKKKKVLTKVIGIIVNNSSMHIFCYSLFELVIINQNFITSSFCDLTFFLWQIQDHVLARPDAFRSALCNVLLLQYSQQLMGKIKPHPTITIWKVLYVDCSSLFMVCMPEHSISDSWARYDMESPVLGSHCSFLIGGPVVWFLVQCISSSQTVPWCRDIIKYLRPCRRGLEESRGIQWSSSLSLGQHF